MCMVKVRHRYDLTRINFTYVYNTKTLTKFNKIKRLYLDNNFCYAYTCCLSIQISLLMYSVCSFFKGFLLFIGCVLKAACDIYLKLRNAMSAHSSIG